jgi:hypothetical protein
MIKKRGERDVHKIGREKGGLQGLKGNVQTERKSKERKT